jgi:hypothetical protein
VLYGNFCGLGEGSFCKLGYAWIKVTYILNSGICTSLVAVSKYVYRVSKILRKPFCIDKTNFYTK